VEPSAVLLDVEMQINQRPLSYLEDDIGLTILSPSTFLFFSNAQISYQTKKHGESRIKISADEPNTLKLARITYGTLGRKNTNRHYTKGTT